MIILDASIVNIALPSAQADLDISNADRQWMVTAYTLAFGALLLLGGRIADYTGRKRTFIIGLLGFAGASALGGLAPNQELLFAARALQGAFAALMAPAALSIVTVTFTEPKERAKAFGVFGALAGGGAAIGLIVGGVLTEYASWRWCLGVNVPVRPDRGGGGDPAGPREQGARRHQVRRARASCWRRSGCSRWSTASPRPPGSKNPDDPQFHRGAGLGRPEHADVPDRSRWCCSSRSCSGSAGPATRCCRCASSWTATAAGRSWCSCSWAPGCSRCSCS